MVTPSLDTLTREATITPQGTLNFAMLAKLRDGVIVAPTAGLARRLARSDNRRAVPPSGHDEESRLRPDAGRLVDSPTDSLRDAMKNSDNLKKAGDAISDLVRKK